MSERDEGYIAAIGDMMKEINEWKLDHEQVIGPMASGYRHALNVLASVLEGMRDRVAAALVLDEPSLEAAIAEHQACYDKWERAAWPRLVAQRTSGRTEKVRCPECSGYGKNVTASNPGEFVDGRKPGNLPVCRRCGGHGVVTEFAGETVP